MNDLPEFAEEYTTAERVRYVAIGLTLGLLIVAVGKLWLFPSLGEFAVSAPCQTVFGIGGVEVLWYGLFVGLPLSATLLFAFTFGRRGYKILKSSQVPPIGEKVFRPTRITRGFKAKIIGYMNVLAFLPAFAIAIWGAFQAHTLSSQGQVNPCTKTANPSIIERASIEGRRQPPPEAHFER